MSQGSPYIADTIPVIVGASQIQNATPAQLAAAFAGHTVTPLGNFDFPWNGAVLEFMAGDTQTVPSDLLAALVAAGAPVILPLNLNTAAASQFLGALLGCAM